MWISELIINFLLGNRDIRSHGQPITKAQFNDFIFMAFLMGSPNPLSRMAYQRHFPIKPVRMISRSFNAFKEIPQNTFELGD